MLPPSLFPPAVPTWQRWSGLDTGAYLARASQLIRATDITAPPRNDEAGRFLRGLKSPVDCRFQ
jgi:hypothetical protein